MNLAKVSFDTEKALRIIKTISGYSALEYKMLEYRQAKMRECMLVITRIEGWLENKSSVEDWPSFIKEFHITQLSFNYMKRVSPFFHDDIRYFIEELRTSVNNYYVVVKNADDHDFKKANFLIQLDEMREQSIRQLKALRDVLIKQRPQKDLFKNYFKVKTAPIKKKYNRFLIYMYKDMFEA